MSVTAKRLSRFPTANKVLRTEAPAAELRLLNNRCSSQV